MKMSLTLTGTASQLAAVLAALPHDVQPEPIAVPGLPVAAPSPMPVLAGDPSDNGPVDANAPALDVEGLPWDARIHGKTKTRNQDGSWRKRRGVDETVLAAIEAELRASLAPPMPVEAICLPPMPDIAPAPPPPEVPVVVVPPPMPVPVEAPAAVVAAPPPMPMPVEAPTPVPVPAPPPAAPSPEATPEHLDFTQFMQHLSGQMTKRDAAGTPLINTDVLAAYAVEISTAFITAGHITEPLKAITDIATNQAMIDYAVALLKRDGRW